MYSPGFRADSGRFGAGLGRFWVGFRRIWVGFRRNLVYNTPTPPPGGFSIITRSLTMEIERNLVQMIRTGPPEVSGRFGQVLGRF